MKFEFPDEVASSQEFILLCTPNRDQAHIGKLARQALFCDLAELLMEFEHVIRNIRLQTDDATGLWYATAECYSKVPLADAAVAMDRTNDVVNDTLSEIMDEIAHASLHRDLDGLVVTRKTPEILAPLGRLLAEKSKNAVIGARKTARPS